MAITSPTPIIPATSSSAALPRRRFYRSPLTRRRSVTDLTEESLDEHNRRTSPYYRGLLSRPPPGAGSPGRESRVTSVSTKSSLSTIIIRIQELGSTCFRGKPAIKPVPPKPADGGLGPPVAQLIINPARMSVSRRMSVSVVKDVVEIGSIRGRLIPGGACTVGDDKKGGPSAVAGKSLRERVVTFPMASEEARGREPRQDHPVQTPPKAATMIPTAMAAKVVMERQFVWADRYRPKALKDFICNKDRAAYLHKLVSNYVIICLYMYIPYYTLLYYKYNHYTYHILLIRLYTTIMAASHIFSPLII